MKYLYLFAFCCLISCATETKPLDPCFMEAGIKTAKSFDKDNPLGEKTEKFSSKLYYIQHGAEYGTSKFFFSENLEINLQKNHDILSEVSKRHSSAYIVGFAAETSNVNDNANKKLNSKNLNMIISNDVSDKSIGFDSDDNEVHVITKNETIFLKKNKKIKIAREILNIIALNTKS